MLAARLISAEATLPVGSIISHYKNGDLYVVTDHSIREFNGQPWVTFQSGPIKFGRPLSEMVELVDYEGSVMQRFEILRHD
jgi:hypothetical protein